MNGVVTKELYKKLKSGVKDKKLLDLLKVIENDKMDEIEKYYNSINTDLKLTDRKLPSPKYIKNKVSEILYKTRSLKDLENLSKSLTNYLTEEIIKNIMDIFEQIIKKKLTYLFLII